MLRTRWISGAACAIATLVLAASAVAARPLSVEVWTDRGDDAVYSPGEVMQVKARTNDDAYLLVYEIDAEGRVTVLFPWRRGSGMVEGRSTLRLPPENSRYELTVERETGQGYIVALASRRPFREMPWYLRPFDPQGEEMGWEGRHDEIDGFDEDGRVVGDPTVAIERIRRVVLGEPGDVDEFATSYATYYVGHQVRYPRYLCYDCHRPRHWSWWDGFDPYWTTCSVIDFRVNWNWCWGPCMWSSHVPYYYYVVRQDCPPRYRGWYDRHERWSSWDGRRRWDDLWGGPLVRNKTAPPPGYVPPPVKGGDFPRGTPPGYIKTTGAGGGRAGLPIGRNRPDLGEDGKGSSGQGSGGQVWRTPGGSTGSGGKDRAGTKDTPRFQPPRPTNPDGTRNPAGRGDSPASEKPGYGGTREQPRREPARYDPPRQEQPRYEPPREQPRREPPRYDPPREQPRQEPPRQEPRRDPPRQDPPKQDTPRQDPPKRDPGSSGGNPKHKG